jgi:hypothetical protein
MKWNEVFCNTFKELRKRIEPESRRKLDLTVPSFPMIETCRANDFDFFQPFINAGKLTVSQMHHAAQRYYLGKTKSGLPMFWMINDMLQILDAHIGTDAWLFPLLKKREPVLQYVRVEHCLFGLHLLNTDSVCHTDLSDPTENSMTNTNSSVSSVVEKPICIIESESSAVVLSELFPESIWMAYATTSHLTPDLFAPLQGRTVVLYPRTDPYGNTHLFFHDLASQVSQDYGIDITVDETLESHATATQKQRCIDLLDFLLESLTHTDLTDPTDS